MNEIERARTSYMCILFIYHIYPHRLNLFKCIPVVLLSNEWPVVHRTVSQYQVNSRRHTHTQLDCMDQQLIIDGGHCIQVVFAFVRQLNSCCPQIVAIIQSTAPNPTGHHMLFSLLLEAPQLHVLLKGIYHYKKHTMPDTHAIKYLYKSTTTYRHTCPS